jgi:hypothetical protein
MTDNKGTYTYGDLLGDALSIQIYGSRTRILSSSHKKHTKHKKKIVMFCSNLLLMAINMGEK